MGLRGQQLSELGCRESEAAVVIEGVLIEMRHFRSGAPAPDDINELLAIKLCRAQVGALAGGARIAMFVAVHAVAELAVSLFMK